MCLEDCLVHRLVGQVFIDNPNNEKYMEHLDQNITLNCVNNLGWTTSSENGGHRMSTKSHLQHAKACHGIIRIRGGRRSDI